MNIKLTFGYLDLYMEDVTSEMVDALQRGVLCDYSYKDNKRVEYICETKQIITIVPKGSTPTQTHGEVFNGDQD